MEKYISLNALVAEIEKKKIPFKKDIEDGVYPTYLCALMDFEDFINTLEAKEVDLDYIKKELDEVVRIYKPTGHFGWGTLYNVATHFYELGLKAQKGE